MAVRLPISREASLHERVQEVHTSPDLYRKKKLVQKTMQA